MLMSISLGFPSHGTPLSSGNIRGKPKGWRWQWQSVLLGCGPTSHQHLSLASCSPFGEVFTSVLWLIRESRLPALIRYSLISVREWKTSKRMPLRVASRAIIYLSGKQNLSMEALQPSMAPEDVLGCPSESQGDDNRHA